MNDFNELKENFDRSRKCGRCGQKDLSLYYMIETQEFWCKDCGDAVPINEYIGELTDEDLSPESRYDIYLRNVAEHNKYKKFRTDENPPKTFDDWRKNVLE